MKFFKMDPKTKIETRRLQYVVKKLHCESTRGRGRQEHIRPSPAPLSHRSDNSRFGFASSDPKKILPIALRLPAPPIFSHSQPARATLNRPIRSPSLVCVVAIWQQTPTSPTPPSTGSHGLRDPPTSSWTASPSLCRVQLSCPVKTLR